MITFNVDDEKLIDELVLVFKLFYSEDELESLNGEVTIEQEVTLTGRVLAIGGVKEKCLAAHRIGIDTIILPKENKKNADEIPSSIKGKLNLLFADDVKEVLEAALIGVDENDN